MGIPAAVVAAGITAAGQGAQAYAQGKMNKKTREWNEKMYAIQRQDALSDWATVNEYNSPAAQMQRFRDAGLSPHLIYGQTNEAPAVRSADAPSWNPRAAEYGSIGRDSIQSYFNAKMNEAQINNLQETISTQQSEQVLKAAQTAATIQGTAKTKFDLEQAQSLSQYVIEAAKQNVAKLSAETTQLIDNNERQAALTANTLQQGLENILKIRLDRIKTQADTESTRAQTRQIEQAILNLKKDNEVKEESLKLLRRGQNPNDPTWLRKLGEFLEKYLAPPRTDGPGMKNFNWKF